MSTQETIQRNKVRPTEQDYEALRAIGMQYIEQFSRDIWTDYNVHDPGVTMLEALCFAITDLGFRTALPIEDLLARPHEDKTKDFFTAREILPCNPVTIDDIRKKIIDVPGVQNAWVTAFTDEPCSTSKPHAAYYIDCDPPNQQFTIQAHEPTGEHAFEPRNIEGLYKFQLLLEEDAVLGDLNIPAIDWEMTDAVSGRRKALVRFIFPINVAQMYPRKTGELSLLEKLASGDVTGFTITEFASVLRTTFNLTLQLGAQSVVMEQVAFQIQPVQPGLTMADLRDELELYLLSADATVQATIISKIFQRFALKMAMVSTIINQVYCMYQRIRNLCEDVIRIGIVPSQEIAICADIEVEPGADLESILGKLYFEADTFFSPPVRFFMLSEMLQQKIPVQEIFEGPLLNHGFIPDDTLHAAVLYDRVHLSDLYQLIMDIPGVKTIQYLQITNYLHGIAQTEGIPSSTHPSWTLQLGDFFHLNLDRVRSKIIFFKGNMPITADKQVADRIYADMKAAIARPRLNAALPMVNDLEIPNGKSHHLSDYFSVQNDLPATYGVGRDGIPAGSNKARNAHIKQLKGYLLFFDQLLANYLSQLAQVKNLFSVSYTGNDTYFVQPVYDVPTPADEEDRNFFGTAALLKDFEIPDVAGVETDDETTYETEWNDFIDPPGTENDYMKTLKAISGNDENNLERRNRFLDHLLARFAESFTDYAMMLYSVTGATLETSGQKTAAAIAADKIQFLKQYPLISYNRGKGQFYKRCPQGTGGALSKTGKSDAALMEFDFFTTPHPANTTGLQLRAATLLGMQVNDQRLLVVGFFEAIETSPDNFVYEIQLGEGGEKLRSENTYATDKAAFEGIEALVALTLAAIEEDRFRVMEAGGEFFVEAFTSDDTVIAKSTTGFADEATAIEAIAALKALFFRDGMKIIDHLLLRPLPIVDTVHIINNPAELLPEDPRLESVGFFPLCAELNPDCDCPETDYYSFRVSVLLPYWPPRFRNMDFRRFAEAAIHREVPAHILPKFCWISMYDMWRFETAYLAWFEENTKYKPNMTLLRPLLKKLISVINTVSNVYPVGYLHDCDNPGTDTPVILNQTILGTF